METAKTFDKRITLNDMCRSLDCSPHNLPAGFKERFESVNTCYRSISVSESEEYVLDILHQINSPKIRRNRDQNLDKWENGWSENLLSFMESKKEESLKPKYFRPSKFFRYHKTIIIPENQHIEYDLFTVIRHYIFQQYFSGFDSIYELGCGSCQNIYALTRLFHNQRIVGLDWTAASRNIAQYIGKHSQGNVTGVIFDLMNPNEELKIRNKSLFFSIHALEQLGVNHEKLLSFLLKKKPALVFHYEPIIELFDKSNLYDYLALLYCKKRNYLRGYLAAIYNLAKSGKIEIIKEIRPCIGGVFHDSSFIIWRPL